MTKRAVEAFASERDVALDVLRSLSDAEWDAPSGCEGWSVKDVVIHMSSTLQLVADAENAEFPDPSLPAEEGIDKVVASRRGMSNAEVLALYADVSEKAEASINGLQLDGIADTELPMGDLGTHPMHMLANAFAFDLYTHLRVDLVPPRGPLDRSLPEVQPVVLDATLEWLLAGLPQMCTEALRPQVTKPLVLELTGPGAGTWTIAPTDDQSRACVVTEGAAADAAATVVSSAPDFVQWSTKRTDWRDSVTIEGDEKLAGGVLDAINLI
jgi:uncharacterized protein (TIGR03083 family)